MKYRIVTEQHDWRTIHYIQKRFLFLWWWVDNSLSTSKEEVETKLKMLKEGKTIEYFK